MPLEAKHLTISELARAASVGIETIRYYQRRGLLPQPDRHHGRIRRYGAADVGRLTFIKTAQQLGFSLSEVSELLKLDDGTRCNEARALAEGKLDDVRRKLDHLQRLEQVLQGLVRDCARHRGRICCPLIVSLQEGVSAIADDH